MTNRDLAVVGIIAAIVLAKRGRASAQSSRSPKAPSEKSSVAKKQVDLSSPPTTNETTTAKVDTATAVGAVHVLTDFATSNGFREDALTGDTNLVIDPDITTESVSVEAGIGPKGLGMINFSLGIGGEKPIETDPEMVLPGDIDRELGKKGQVPTGRKLSRETLGEIGARVKRAIISLQGAPSGDASRSF